MKRIVFILMVLFCFSYQAQEQFEEEKIRAILLNEINSIRGEKNLPLLKSDEILDAAAFDQAEYIMGLNKVVHIQDKSKKKTLMDRIAYYEGLHAQAGENAAILSIGGKEKINLGGQRVLIDNYEKLVSAAVVSWLDEDEGSLNLLDPDFYQIGTSVVSNEDEVITLVVITASLPYKLPDGYDYSKGDYGTEVYDKTVCEKFQEKYPSISQLLSDAFIIENGELFFYHHDLKFVQSLLESGGDGIAVDIIQDEQFNCANGNRIFPGSIHDGYMLRPIRKNNLYSSNLLADTGKVKVSFGELPSFYQNGKVEFNGIIIKDGKHCATIPYNKIETNSIRWFDLSYALAGDSTNKEYHWDDTINYKINLDNKGEWKNTLNKKREYLNKVNFSMSTLDFKISISPAHEELLSTINKEMLVSILTSDESVISDLSDNVNWTAYQKFQVGTFYQLDTQEMDSLQIADYLKGKLKEDNELKEFLEGLNTLRIQIVGTATISKEQDFEDRKSLIKSLIEEDRVEPALYVQKSLIEEIEESNLTLDQLPDIDPNQKKHMLPFINNLIVLNDNLGDQSYDGNPTHLALLELHLIDKKQTEIAFNYHVSELKYWSKAIGEIKKFEEWNVGFTKLRPKVGKSEFARTMLNYNLIAADYYFSKVNFKERKKAFDEILKWHKASKLTNEETLLLAQYLCYQDQFSKAIELLLPYVKKENPNEGILMYFLQIAIYDEVLVTEKMYVKKMQEAKDLYPDAFCNLFSKKVMGVQRLKNTEIKKLYCAQCKN